MTFLPQPPEPLEKESSYAIRKGHSDLIYKMDFSRMLSPSSDLAPRLLNHSKKTLAAAENAIRLYGQKRDAQKKDLKTAVKALERARGSLELAYSYPSSKAAGNAAIASKAAELYRHILAVKCLLGPSMHLEAMIALESKARRP